MCEAHKLKAVQLHGDESPEECSKLKEIEVEVIKSFAMLNEFDFNELSFYESACDYFLFDTKGFLPVEMDSILTGLY